MSWDTVPDVKRDAGARSEAIPKDADAQCKGHACVWDDTKKRRTGRASGRVGVGHAAAPRRCGTHWGSSCRDLLRHDLLLGLVSLLVVVAEEGLLQGHLAGRGERELLLQPLGGRRRLVPQLDELQLGDAPLACRASI